MTFIADNLRVEVEGTPPGGTLVNLVKNPGGDLGAWGWLTPVSAAIMLGLNDRVATGNRVALQYRAAGGGVANYFYTENLPVTAGQWVNAGWVAPYAWGYYRQRIEFLNSALGLVSSTAQTGYLQGSAARVVAAAAQVPATAVWARVRFDTYSTNTGTAPAAGAKLALYDVTMAQAASAATLASLPYSEPVYWLDITGKHASVVIEREEFGPSTCTAVIPDATLDPAAATTLRPGKRVRVSSRDSSGVWEAIFTGKTDRLDVTYRLKDLPTSNPRHARIELAALDAVPELAGVPRRTGVNAVRELAFSMEGAGVPWVVNDYSGQLTSADVTIASLNDNATLLDQIAAVRDSKNGHAWLDRFGVLRAYDQATMPQGANALPNGDLDVDTTGWTAGPQSTIARSTATVYEGGGSLSVTNNAGFTATAYATTPDLAVPVRPGFKYRLKGRVIAAGGGGKNAHLAVNFYDAVGASVGSATGPAVTTDGITWKLMQGDVTAPAGAASMQLRPTIDASNNLEQHFFDAMRVEGPGLLVDESAYSRADVGFDTDRCINSVAVKVLRYYTATGQTQEVTYGPYQDAASIAQWGLHHRDVVLQGPNLTGANAQTFASGILASNATPTVGISSALVPIDTTAALPFARVDLYDLVGTVNAAKSLRQTQRVTAIKHTIDAAGGPGDLGAWTVELEFARQGGVAPPVSQPAVQPVGSDTEGTWRYIGTAGNPAFQNSWVNYSAGPSTEASFMRENGWVRLRGMIKSGTPGGTSVAFTLPAGSRPLAHEYFATIASGNGVARVDVDSNGTVTIVTGSTAWTSLAGIGFAAEN